MSDWNHRPEGAVALNPLFAWPPQPAAVLRWYAGYWLAITSSTVTILFSVIVFYMFLPPLEAMKSFELGWIARVYLARH